MPSDNEVWFQTPPPDPNDPTPSDASIIWGDFKVVAFFVTPGEATDLYPGFDTMFATKDGSGFHFGFDRSGSAQTADWWNEHISATATTFDHGAGTLNAAIQGTLTLYVSGSSYPGNPALVWDNVFLAQGKAGADNNWWFGITGATQVTGGNVISAQTTDGKYNIQFQRGGLGDDDDVVYVNL